MTALVHSRLFVTRLGRAGIPLHPPFTMPLSMGTTYRVWDAARARATDNEAWLRQRLHADPARSSLRLMYAVGGRGGKAPTIGKYAKAQLDALHEDVSWRLALISNWTKGVPEVELLPLRSRP